MTAAPGAAPGAAAQPTAAPVAGHRHGHDVGEHLYVHRHTPIHLLPPEVKLVALVAFVFIVVATPVRQVWAFALYAAMLVGIAALARLPARVVAPRMVVEVPFLVFATLMPFTGPEPSVEVLGLSLSEAGLWAGFGIVAKGTIGVLGAIILAATTPARDLLAGLKTLRVPATLVQIAAFMLRYLHVVGAEMARMRIARESRGFEARGVRSWPVLAHSAGTLFIRSYERGERVHLAMLSRGYAGSMPDLDDLQASRSQWIRGLALPTLALLVCLSAWAVHR
jgi:cobalt/nickel transport system permease protein